jgi:hypothetical protein
MVTRTNLADVERRRLKGFLLERLENGVIRRGAIRDGAVLVGVSHCTVSRLWRKWKVAHENALNGVWDVTTGKKANG